MRALRHLLTVAPDEERLAAAIAILMLATAAGAAMGTAAIEALLFSSFDLAKLPLLYVALGVTTFALTLVASGMLAGGDRARLYVALPVVLAAVVVLLRVGAASGVGWVYAILWLGLNVVTTLQGIAAWGLAGAVCDVRQSKRLFPLFNAAKIGGAVVGSLFVGLAVHRVAVADLIFVWAATLALSGAIAFSLRRRVVRAEATAARAGLIAEMGAGFAIVRRSALLRLLAVALVLFSLLYFSLALPFSRGSQAAYPDPAELAAFLGLFNGATTLAALVVSLVAANRLYARIGVVNAIVAFAAVYLAGFVAIAASGAFAVLVTARFAQTVWLGGIADTAYQALFNPIPAERRDQIRAFMEGVPGQAGIALAGLVLLVGDRIDPIAIAVGGMVASVATVWVMLRARPAYARALADALRAGRPQPFLTEDDPFGALRTDAQALGVMLAGLSDADPAVRRVAAEILRQLALPSTRDALVTALEDTDDEVRRSAVGGLAALGEGAPLLRFRADPDPVVRAFLAIAAGPAAVSSLALSGDVEARRALAERVAADDGVLVTLVRDADALVRRAAVATLSHRPAAAIGLLETAVADRDPLVSAAAIEALGFTRTHAARGLLWRIARDASVSARDDCLHLARLGRPTEGPAAIVTDTLRERAGLPAAVAVRAILGLSARAGGAELVLEALASADRDRRAGAIELLEAEAAEVVRPLFPLWEPAATDDVAARATLELLATQDPDELIRDAARRAISGGVAMETLPTISVLERMLFLRKVGLFAELAPSDLKHIAGLAREELHQDAAVLGREGEMGDRMFIIASGTVRVSTHGRVVARRGRGDPIGEMSIAAGLPRVADLVCEDEVRVLVLARRDFEAILRDRPQVAQGIIRVLSVRLAELQNAA